MPWSSPELLELPLIHRKGTDNATFIGSQMVCRPRDFATPEASVIATLGARLPYILPMCRFVHYLKCIARDWVGGSRLSPSHRALASTSHPRK